MFQLLLLLVYVPLIVLMGIGMAMGTRDHPSALFFLALVVLALVGLAAIIPCLAVQVRRFHDQDKSGWFVLLGFIPYVGSLIVLVFMCLRGTPGANRFGPDPLQQ